MTEGHRLLQSSTESADRNHARASSSSMAIRQLATGYARSKSPSRKLFNLAALFLLASLLTTWTCSAATLQWDSIQSTNLMGFPLYQSIGTAPFIVVTNLGPTATTVNWPVSATETTRFYLTASQSSPPYPIPESDPSNTVTNTPPPPTGIVSLSKPTLNTTNLVQGTALNITAKLTNSTSASFSILSGSIVLLAPGATQSNGPYIYAASIPAQTVSAGATATFTATWPTTTATTLGGWTTYAVVQDSGGTWIAGPQTPFNVIAPPTPLPNLAPSNLRLSAITSSRIDLVWDSDRQDATRIEKSENTSPFSAIATVPAGTLHYTYGSIRKNRDYRFRVAWVGNPNYSNQVFFSTR